MDLADMDVDAMHGRERIDRDHDLLDALRRGDPTAPDALMTRYRRRALRLASGIIGNHEDAEDVVQDAFWSVVRKIDAFRGDSAFGSWLYRIVVNAAYQNRRRRRASRDEASLDDVVPGPVNEWLAAAEDPALRAERRCALTAAMEELPAAARAVVLLREVEGRSYVEVAEALGVSAGLVKGRAHRARLFLRKRLACRS
jgi:RNA polymerase sigma-70 factor (ECF subfamily)